MFVAVVCRRTSNMQSGGTNGAWSSFIGGNKDTVVTKAIAHAQKLNERNNPGPYVVLVGTVTQEARPPVTYELIDIPVDDSPVALAALPVAEDVP